MTRLLRFTAIVLYLVAALGCSAPAALQPSAPGGTSHRLLVLPEDASRTNRNAIKSAIAAARRSIYLTIYELQDRDIVDSLVAARAANTALDVRVIFNCSSFKGCSQPGQGGPADPNAAAKQAFAAAGIKWKNADPSFTVTHQKTFVFDEAIAIIMTFNLSPSYFASARDFGVITSDRDEVREIVAVFQNDWATPLIPSTPTLLVWSPTNSRDRIMSVIASATQSLDVYMEEFEDRRIADALIAAAKRLTASGGLVRVITAVLPVPGNPSSDGNLAMRQYLNKNEVLARYGNWPVDPDNPGGPATYIHAKMMLADHGTPRARAYLGSQNFSATSLDRNRELGIILEAGKDASLLDTLNAVFSGDWPRSKADPR
jgi:cardiolipin synthase